MAENITLSAETRSQIDSLALRGGPLVVCDVDEVVLRFIGPLERHLDRLGYDLIARSYSLAGNIIHRHTETPLAAADVHALLHDFFAVANGDQPPVDGAAESLDALATFADVVLLTNMPTPFRQDRIDALARLGIHHPVVTNDGPKGPAVEHLAARAGEAVVFLDDSPSNLTSVRRTVDRARLVHFIADPRFLALATTVEGVELRTGDWGEARAFIETVCRAPAREA